MSSAIRAMLRPPARGAAPAFLPRRPALLVVFAVLVAGCAGARPNPPSRGIEIAVTFDDLPWWGRDHSGADRVRVSEEVARVLRSHGVPPSYGFLTGKRLEHPEDLASLQAWVAGGQLLGNHTFSHPFVRSDAEIPKYLADVAANEAVLADVAGTSDWKVFRFPYLREPADATSRRALRDDLAARGYRVADVTIDFWDFAWNAPFARCTERADARATAALTTTFVDYGLAFLAWSDAAIRRALGRRIPHVLLLHAGAIDAAALDALLSAYERKAHVRWTSLDRALSDPAYRLEPVGSRKAPVAGARGKWRSTGFHERLVAGPEARRTARPAYPPVPLPLLDAICR